jgi:hypothetical protein
MAKEQNVERIEISLPKIDFVKVTIVGKTPYVGTNWSEESKDDLVKSQSEKGSKTKIRPLRNIEKEVHGKRHIEEGVDCMPVQAIKASIIDTTRDLWKLKAGICSVDILRSITIIGDIGHYTTIRDENGKPLEPTAFNAVVKLPRGQSMIAYRPQYKNWFANIEIQFLADRFTKTDVLNLLARAGITSGLGDTRKIGGGRFTIKA